MSHAPSPRRLRIRSWDIAKARSRAAPRRPFHHVRDAQTVARSRENAVDDRSEQENWNTGCTEVPSQPS